MRTYPTAKNSNNSLHCHTINSVSSFQLLRCQQISPFTRLFVPMYAARGANFLPVPGSLE